MVTGGDNLGRIGMIVNIEKHLGSFDAVLKNYMKDTNGNSFAASFPTFCYGQRQQTMDFPSPWRGHAPHRCWRERDRLAAKQSSGESELSVT